METLIIFVIIIVALIAFCICNMQELRKMLYDMLQVELFIMRQNIQLYILKRRIKRRAMRKIKFTKLY